MNPRRLELRARAARRWPPRLRRTPRRRAPGPARRSDRAQDRLHAFDVPAAAARRRPSRATSPPARDRRRRPPPRRRGPSPPPALRSSTSDSRLSTAEAVRRTATRSSATSATAAAARASVTDSRTLGARAAAAPATGAANPVRRSSENSRLARRRPQFGDHLVEQSRPARGCRRRGSSSAPPTTRAGAAWLLPRRPVAASCRSIVRESGRARAAPRRSSRRSRPRPASPRNATARSDVAYRCVRGRSTLGSGRLISCSAGGPADRGDDEREHEPIADHGRFAVTRNRAAIGQKDPEDRAGVAALRAGERDDDGRQAEQDQQPDRRGAA